MRARAVAFSGVWLVVGLVLYAVGVFGLGRGLEDHCSGLSAERGYVASQQSGSFWPPRFTCVLEGPDDPAEVTPLLVEQAAVAILRTGWHLGMPVAWVSLGVLVWRRRPAGWPGAQEAH